MCGVHGNNHQTMSRLHVFLHCVFQIWLILNGRQEGMYNHEYINISQYDHKAPYKCNVNIKTLIIDTSKMHLLMNSSVHMVAPTRLNNHKQIE